MKIEVNLNDVFCDEEGMPCESLQETVERQVVAALTKKVEAGIGKQIDAQVAAVITSKLTEIANDMLPSLAKDMLNTPYRTVSKWGSQGEETTFRDELVRVITEQMVYKKTQYKHDRNVFTKTVDDVIEENMMSFQSEFNKIVTEQFKKEALAYAVSKMKKALGITS